LLHRAHLVYRQLGTSRVPLNPTALASREQPDNKMSAKGNKAKASKESKGNTKLNYLQKKEGNFFLVTRDIVKD